VSSTTIRVDEKIRAKLKILSKKEGVSIQSIIEKAVNFYQRQKFLDDLNKSYAVSKNTEEDALWDNTLNDGLDNEEWNEKGEVIS